MLRITVRVANSARIEGRMWTMRIDGVIMIIRADFPFCVTEDVLVSVAEVVAA